MTTETLTEEQKMQLVPGIVFVDGPAGRRARLADTGPDVWEVIGPWRDSHGDFAWLRWYYSWLPDAVLKTALRYYELFPDEIDARLAENDRLLADLRRNGPYLAGRPYQR